MYLTYWAVSSLYTLMGSVIISVMFSGFSNKTSGAGVDEDPSEGGLWGLNVTEGSSDDSDGSSRYSLGQGGEVVVGSTMISFTAMSYSIWDWIVSTQVTIRGQLRVNRPPNSLGIFIVMSKCLQKFTCSHITLPTFQQHSSLIDLKKVHDYHLGWFTWVLQREKHIVIYVIQINPCLQDIGRGVWP